MVVYACLTVGRPAANSEAGVSLVGACVREINENKGKERKMKEIEGNWGELGGTGGDWGGLHRFLEILKH